MKSRPVRTVIFPVGGFGTRFLPATKSMPKEMLPVVDKPIIHYAFEEAQAAGIEKFIFVTGRNKNAISNHFDHSYELQSHLSKKNKQKELELTQSWLPAPGNIMFTRQQEMLGLGHAVWCARNMVGNEPFAVILADDMILSGTPCLKQMLDAYTKTGGNMFAVQDVPREKTNQYGIVDIDPAATAHPRVVRARSVVEKPKPEDAPSTLSVIGRYILQPEIFDVLASQKPGAGGEIQLTDAIQTLTASQPTYGYRFEGTRYDCGQRLGYVMANLAFALQDKELSGSLRPEIQALLQ